jgi:hypothetical protein
VSEHDDEPSGSAPAQVAHLVQEVQELGFQAARSIVERFAALFDQFAASTGGTGRTDGADAEGDASVSGMIAGSAPSGPVTQADVQQAASSYFAVLGELNEAGLRFLDAVRWWQPPTNAEHNGGLRLPDVAPGGRVSAKLWLHNTTAKDARDLRPWCPGMTDHTGAAMDASAVTFAPTRLDRLDPDASAEILVTADVARDATPGVYHGLILVDGLPEVVFPLRVAVRSSERGR